MRFNILKEKKYKMEETKQFGKIYDINADEYENVDIDTAEFSVRINNRLRNAGIETIGDLLKCTYSRLANLNGFGVKCFKEIYEYLEKLQMEVGFVRENEKVIEYHALPKEFYENSDLIIKGDFSFILGEEETRELLNKYKEAQWLIGSELAKECVDNPKYAEVLRKEFYNYSKATVYAQKAIDDLPCGRKKKRAVYFINACSSVSSGKIELQNRNKSLSESLEEYIKANAKELLNDNSVLSKFVKACTYDFKRLTTHFFEKIRENKRTYEIIRQRVVGNTLEQVGIEFAVTRERVRQIEKKVSQSFINWVKRNSIILKIVADEDGRCVLIPSVFDIYLLEYADIFRYLLKINEGEFYNVFYDKELDLFVIGDKTLIAKAQEYVEELPEQFNVALFNELVERGFIENNLPKELVCRIIEENYKKTGDVYHCSRLTFGKIYADVLKKHYQRGIWVYNDSELDEFRKHVREDYGDIKLPKHNRALASRISAIGILYGRGIYGPKKDKYLSNELANKIHEFICESESPIFLTNTLYSMFEEELISEGVHNKYYLQGILKELFSGEFIFRRDYVSKDCNLTSVYSEIVKFIEKAMYPVTKQQIVEAFPGVTEIVINISINDPDIINLFGVYMHSNKIKLNADDRNYIKNSIEKFFDKNDFIHCKDIFERIQCDNPILLLNNGIYQAFGLYSVIEYLYRDQMEFSRPYIGKKGVKITRTFEQLHDMVLESEIIELSDIMSVARENHFQVNSILEFADSCNSTHLLINDSELAELHYIGITEEIAKEIEQIIIEEISETKLITDLCCIPRFRALNVPWTKWLVYSVLLKWSSELEVTVTSAIFRQAQPIVAIKGSLKEIDVSKLGNRDTDPYMPDNLDNIDDLISNIILQEIEVE